MLDSVRSFIVDLPEHLRAADVLDIAVIAVVLYFLLTAMRRRGSRALGVALSAIVVLYVASHALGMYLTSGLFRVGLTAMLLALVVVFQEDLRRIFERMRTWRLRERPGAGRRPPGLDELVDAVGTMAERRMGALLVFEGREAIDVHVHGGTEVDGKVSEPLLLSIFHCETPGHDGAAILERGRVERIGVHLPLSTDIAQLGGHGTRHAAALGLAERTDAMVVVVSEERGTISLAHRGRLFPVPSAAALQQHLVEFLAPPKQPVRRRWLTKSPGLKLASVAAAMVLWVFAAHRVDQVQRTFVVPIEYRNVPAGWAVEKVDRVEARVDLVGPERAFDELDPKELVISLDPSDLEQGRQRVPLTHDQLNEPPGLSVARFDPRAVTVDANRMVEVEVPVQVRLNGADPDVAQASPGVVRLLVPEEGSERVRAVRTDPVSLQELQKGKVQVNLALPPKARLPEKTRPKVEVTLRPQSG